MAMPIELVLSARAFNRTFCPCSYSKLWALQRGKATWTKFFKREEEPEDWSAQIRKSKPDDGPSTLSRLDSLKKKEGLVSVRGYSPPKDVEEKVASIAKSVLQKPMDPHSVLDDRTVKFELMTRLMSEFDHFIPNTELNNLHTLDDLIIFFSTPVRDRSSFEDMARLDLPRNLNIQMEPVRFQAETDTFFDGQTAFQGSPTIVSSLKYRRKYKGNQGESRNQPNLTQFEQMVMYSRKT